MVLTAQRAYELIRHTVGGPLSVSEQDIANEAGQFLVSARAWRYLSRSIAHLDMRASFSLTGCTWTEATKTLTKASGFSTYAFLRGDTIEITSGTGATLGHYLIASRVSANAITLDTSIGAAADAQTNIAGAVDASGIALPADFSSLIDPQRRYALNQWIEMIDLAELGQRRQGLPASVTGKVWVALGYAPPSTTGTLVVPRLESYPGSTANRTAEVKLAYRAGWKQLVNDQDKCSLPEDGWLDGLYIQIARAIARGYEEEDKGSRSARLVEMLTGPDWMVAERRDSAMQTSFGPLRGGSMQGSCSNVSNPLGHYSVGNPS